MIKNLSKMILKVENYLNSKPLIADTIVQKYEIVCIRDMGSVSIGACGVGEGVTFDVKIKGTFDNDWHYLITLNVEDYCGITIRHNGIKNLKG